MRAYTGNTSNNKAAVFFSDTAATTQNNIPLASDQLGTNAVIADDEYNDYLLNFTGLALHTDVVVTDTISAQHRIDLSSDQTFVRGDKLVLSRYYEGLSVFETEPFVSKLDVYYETSTSGLVKDLTEEIVTDPNDLPTGLTIKQDTYSFGTGQDPLGVSDDGYGDIAYLYENTTASTYIADLDATEAAANSGTKNLSFSLQKATRLGDNANITNDLAIQEVSGVNKVKVVGTFVYRGNKFDDIDLLVAVTDNTSGGTAYLSVTVEVANSKPTIDTLPTSISVQVDAGDDSSVISSNNNITNGGLVTGGSFNKYSGLNIDHTFSDPFNQEIDLLFKSFQTSEEGKYELKTTSNWTTTAAAEFFKRSAVDRSLAVTVTDSGGLSKLVTTRIDEDPIVKVEGRVYEYEYSTNTESNAIASVTDEGKIAIGAVSSKQGIDVWVTPGTGADPTRPTNMYQSVINQYKPVDVHTNNKVFIKQDLSIGLPEGKYVIIENVASNADKAIIIKSVVTISIIQVSSSSSISILDTYTPTFKS